MKHKLLFFTITILITYINTKKISVKNNLKSPNVNQSEINPELKYAFITILEPSHKPTDYIGGPKVCGNKDQLDKNGILDLEDQESVFDIFRQRFGLPKWNEKDFWVFSNKQRRMNQAAMFVRDLILKQNKSNKHYIRNKKIDKDLVLNKASKFERFYSKKKCPAYYEATRRMQPYFDRKFCREFQGLHECISRKFYFKHNARKLWLLSLCMRDLINDYVSLKHLASWNVTEHLMPPVVRKRHKEKFKGLSDKKLVKLEEMGKEYVFRTSSNSMIQRTMGGQAIRYIMETFENVINNRKYHIHPKKPRIKTSVYIAPTQVFIGLMSVLNQRGTKLNGTSFNPKNFYPELGATLVVQLHKINNEWGIKIYYKQFTYDEFKRIVFPKCDKTTGFCKWQYVKNILEKYYMFHKRYVNYCKATMIS